MIKTVYRRRLPHLHYVGAAFFVTWRLHGSLPKSVAMREQAALDAAIEQVKKQELAAADEKEAISRLNSRYMQKIDDYLDKATQGPHYLKRPAVAELMMQKLHQYDGVYYALEAFCVMSNHVHALLDFQIQLPDNEAVFDASKYVQLDTVMQYLKGGSAYDINKVLGKTGTPLWSTPNFDRYIRDERHYNTVINYIINNPVKAGICSHWRDFPYTYLNGGRGFSPP